MHIIHAASTPSSVGSDAYFTGRVRVDSPFQAAAPGRHGIPIPWARR
ncbi:hypothetical protein SODG_001095 [Sodalis praecaptivus]|nr:hypothetical protein NVIRENTERO_00729 [Sodalis praecaptivus]